MKRQKKKYLKPRRPHDKVRMDEEAGLIKKYGLKNKNEIWKADAAIERVRYQAKMLIVSSDEQKKAFILKLQRKGFAVEKIADILSLNKEDLLKRRLQSIVYKKRLASTPNQARQFIVHKHISIGDQIVNIPSYQIKTEEEPLIRLNVVLKSEEIKSHLEGIKEEIINNS